MFGSSAFFQEFEQWLSPVAADTPCGPDLSLEASFEAIRTEADKDSSIHPGQKTDWARVLADSAAFLNNESKDLWVLCYAVKAVYELRGLAETALALTVAADFMEKFWADLHPALARPARRAAPVVWLCTRLLAVVSVEGFPGDQGEAAAELKKALLRLRDILKERLPETEDALNKLIRQIPDLAKAEKAEAVPAAASSPIQNPPVPAQSAMPAVLPPGMVGEGAIDSQLLPQIFRSLQDQGRRLAGHYLYHNPTDWRGFFLNRAVLWSSVAQVPQADEAGQTQLRPLPRDRANSYQASVDAGHFSDILPSLERSAAKMAFWFDGHHLVARCLEALRAFDALAVLKSSLAAFVHQFPALVNLKYFDGTPFASPSAAHWLESLNISPQEQAPLKLRSDVDDNDEELYCEAMAAFQDRGFDAGLAQLGHLPAARNRACIRHGLLTARYCITAGHPGAGVTLLQELYNRLEEWNLLDWEPDLTADILSLLILAAGRQGLMINEAQMRRLYWLRLPSALATFKE